MPLIKQFLLVLQRLHPTVTAAANTIRAIGRINPVNGLALKNTVPKF